MWRTPKVKLVVVEVDLDQADSWIAHGARRGGKPGGGRGGPSCGAVEPMLGLERMSFYDQWLMVSG